MCGMCGLWGSTEHWSNPARLPGAEESTSNVLLTRMLQADTITSFTRPVGAVVRDWGQSAWIVENFSGATEIVDNLGSIWACVEKLTGKLVDPLSLDFIQALEERQRYS